MLRVIFGTLCIVTCVILVGCTKPPTDPKKDKDKPAAADKKAIEIKAKDAELTLKVGSGKKEVELTFTRGEEAKKEAKITIEPADKDGVKASLSAAKIDEGKTDAPKVTIEVTDAAKVDATVEFTVKAVVDGATKESTATIKIKIEKKS